MCVYWPPCDTVHYSLFACQSKLYISLGGIYTQKGRCPNDTFQKDWSQHILPNDSRIKRKIVFTRKLWFFDCTLLSLVVCSVDKYVVCVDFSIIEMRMHFIYVCVCILCARDSKRNGRANERDRTIVHIRKFRSR